MTRYFLVFFQAAMKRERINGNIALTTEDCYLRLKSAEYVIENKFKDSKISDVMLTNIIELPESDFRDL